ILTASVLDPGITARQIAVILACCAAGAAVFGGGLAVPRLQTGGLGADPLHPARPGSWRVPPRALLRRAGGAGGGAGRVARRGAGWEQSPDGRSGDGPGPCPDPCRRQSPRTRAGLLGAAKAGCWAPGWVKFTRQTVPWAPCWGFSPRKVPPIGLGARG